MNNKEIIFDYIENMMELISKAKTIEAVNMHRDFLFGAICFASYIGYITPNQHPPKMNSKITEEGELNVMLCKAVRKAINRIENKNG